MAYNGRLRRSRIVRTLRCVFNRVAYAVVAKRHPAGPCFDIGSEIYRKLKSIGELADCSSAQAGFKHAARQLDHLKVSTEPSIYDFSSL